MVYRMALRVLAAAIAALACTPGLPPAKAHADPVVVSPGMEILQDNRLCTLGYVDQAARVAYTAGHCRSTGNVVTDKNRNPIGHLATFRDDTPSGSTVAVDQAISDYEVIALDPNVPLNNILPGGRPLVSSPNVAVQPGQAVCHFGVSTGETCGTVEAVNNGWFTMSHGVQSHPGDSGGPVYLAPATGPGQIVGIFNSMWGDFPAAVSWRSTSEQVHQDMAGQVNGG
ncbi:hypothetical protein AWC29_25400 [Mycobacterium triplex]|uniref:Trypsin domain-containing protein n=1 Tax=Mycobacterium triplex TaxID=47839 RepID=A0A024JZV3_9MYCO|nr:hypothetical protein [Mycobacterium triplex]ORX00362.1 hypothetical protein AWC29_25400 [Mycobacterium triplex]CDO88763.1 hypothetical protein BN973_03133 [Mycobacterium triplex]